MDCWKQTTVEIYRAIQMAVVILMGVVNQLGQSKKYLIQVHKLSMNDGIHRMISLLISETAQLHFLSVYSFQGFKFSMTHKKKMLKRKAFLFCLVQTSAVFLCVTVYCMIKLRRNFDKNLVELVDRHTSMKPEHFTDEFNRIFNGNILTMSTTLSLLHCG